MRGAHEKDPKRFGPEPVESETARPGFPRTCVARRGTAADAMTEPDFDRPDLADRLLRKAETAIRARTSRILCVIERCTDEHNYSAVIRSCEALGVQHIWLVDPVEVSYEGVDDGLVDDDDDDGGDDDGADADRARERAEGCSSRTATDRRGGRRTSCSRDERTSSPPSASFPPRARASKPCERPATSSGPRTCPKKRSA